MLYWALVFLIITIITAIFGFSGIVTGAAFAAKVLFGIFLAFFILSLIAGFFHKRPKSQVK